MKSRVSNDCPLVEAAHDREWASRLALSDAIATTRAGLAWPVRSGSPMPNSARSPFAQCLVSGGFETKEGTADKAIPILSQEFAIHTMGQEYVLAAARS